MYSVSRIAWSRLSSLSVWARGERPSSRSGIGGIACAIVFPCDGGGTSAGSFGSLPRFAGSGGGVPGSVPARRCAGTTIDLPRRPGAGDGMTDRTGDSVTGFPRAGGGIVDEPGRGGTALGGIVDGLG